MFDVADKGMFRTLFGPSVMLALPVRDFSEILGLFSRQSNRRRLCCSRRTAESCHRLEPLKITGRSGGTIFLRMFDDILGVKPRPRSSRPGQRPGTNLWPEPDS